MRRRSSAVLFALAIVACSRPNAAAKPSGYTPRWRVGDWWMTKTFGESPGGNGPNWSYRRYDVVRIAKVGRHACFVLMARTAGLHGEVDRDTVASYVRVDNWLVVRQDITHTYNDTICPHWVKNAPLGLLPDEALQIPWFPLRVGDPDTTFKLIKSSDGSAELREIPSIADSASVQRLLDDGDSAWAKRLLDGWDEDSVRVRVVRPAGAVYQVRNELGGDLGTDNSLIVQSLQLWSDDQPWRVYEELIHYTWPKPVRRVIERTWLIAVAHKGM